MRFIRCSLLGLWLALATAAQAQAPVEDRAQAIHRGQLQAGAAYRDLQQVRRDVNFAERDHLEAVESHQAAQKQAGEAKARLDAAKRAFDAARQREAETAKRYDDALHAVERASRQK
jgi:hypothetical protein